MSESPFNRLTEADITALKSMVEPDGRVTPREAIHEDYSHDEMGAVHHFPDVLVEAVSTEQVAAVLRYANDRRLPVTPMLAALLPGAGLAVERLRRVA